MSQEKLYDLVELEARSGIEIQRFKLYRYETAQEMKVQRQAAAILRHPLGTRFVCTGPCWEGDCRCRELHDRRLVDGGEIPPIHDECYCVLEPPLLSRWEIVRAGQEVAIKLPDRDKVTLWIVYSNPTDFPGKWVVRRNIIHRGGTYAPARPHPVVEVAGEVDYVGDSLEEVRSFLPPGLTRLERDPTDPPQICEIWL